MLAQESNEPISVEFPQYGVWCGESRHGQSFRMPEMVHDFFKIIYVFSGNGRIERGNLSLPLKTGDALWVPPRCRHRLLDTRRQPLSLYVVAMKRELVQSLPGAAVALSGFRHFAAPPWGRDLYHVIRRILSEQTLQRPGSEALVLGAAWNAIGLVWRFGSFLRSLDGTPIRSWDASSNPSRARVAAYASGLSASFLEASTLDAAAKSLGLGRRRFSDLFREITGFSWKQCLLAHRIDHAKILLATTERSILSISHECGFGEVAAFHKCFRSLAGSTPARWRQSSRISNQSTRPVKPRNRV